MMVKTLLTNTRGTCVVEYALGLAMLALVALTSLQHVGQSIADMLKPANAALGDEKRITITHDRDGFLDRNK